MTIDSDKLSKALDYLKHRATRSDLEDATRWFFTELNRKTGADKAKQYTLEKIYFLGETLSIHPAEIFVLRVGGKRYRHNYYSGAELIEFIINHTELVLTDFYELREKKTGDSIVFARII